VKILSLFFLALDIVAVALLIASFQNIPGFQYSMLAAACMANLNLLAVAFPR
jgi:hypothetical protein